MDAFQKALESLNELLNENGVIIKGSRYQSPDKLGIAIAIEGLDFSEHDKELQDEISKLKTEIKGLENELEDRRNKINFLVEEMDGVKNLNDECCKENVRLNRENKELHRELQETAITDNLPYEPIAVAEFLINRTTHIPALQICDRTVGGKDAPTYNISKLRQIAEHLLVYCNNNNDGE